MLNLAEEEKMKEKIYIENGQTKIPAILWGQPSQNILIEVHGNMSSKEDRVISTIANKAVDQGYQVVSFDLPEHGERSDDGYGFTPKHALEDLKTVYTFAKTLGKEISVFGCSIGAYYSLLAYHTYEIRKYAFLSPVVNMEGIIKGLMENFQITEERLQNEKQIKLPIGMELDWDYYTFVRNNPLEFDCNGPMNILYGKNDTMCAYEDILSFCQAYQVDLTVDEKGEHYYHTDEHMNEVDAWSQKWL